MLSRIVEFSSVIKSDAGKKMGDDGAEGYSLTSGWDEIAHIWRCVHSLKIMQEEMPRG